VKTIIAIDLFFFSVVGGILTEKGDAVTMKIGKTSVKKALP